MYSVLVWIHQNFKAIIAALDQNPDRIINIFIIIDTPTFNSASENIYIMKVKTQLTVLRVPELPSRKGTSEY